MCWLSTLYAICAVRPLKLIHIFSPFFAPLFTWSTANNAKSIFSKWSCIESCQFARSTAASQHISSVTTVVCVASIAAATIPRSNAIHEWPVQWCTAFSSRSIHTATTNQFTIANGTSSIPTRSTTNTSHPRINHIADHILIIIYEFK